MQDEYPSDEMITVQQWSGYYTHGRQSPPYVSVRQIGLIQIIEEKTEEVDWMKEGF